MTRRFRSDDDRGMVTIYVAVMAASLLFMTGFVVDGGGKIATYMRASSLAGNAARAGAQAADQGELYRTGTVTIDAVEAEDLVDEYLVTAGCPGCGQTTVAGNTVTVTVTMTYSPKMLLGGDRTIVASESATAVRGVETGG